MGLTNSQLRIGDELQAQTERVSFLTLSNTTISKMSVNTRAVIATVSGGVNAVLMLPPVSDVAGEIISIRMNGNADQMTVVSYGDGGSVDASVDWTDQVLTADDDFLVLYSDGFKWFIIASQVT